LKLFLPDLCVSNSHFLKSEECDVVLLT
jgi:hypothetical protein